VFGPMRERLIVIFPVEGFKGEGRIRASKPCGFHSGTEDLLTLPLRGGGVRGGGKEGRKDHKKSAKRYKPQQSFIWEVLLTLDRKKRAYHRTQIQIRYCIKAEGRQE
jgi:hypothetical protein